MINALIKNIRTASDFSSDNEVTLFRTMATELLKKSKGIFIDETHGRVCNVTFKSIRGITETCEISDLLIITTDTKQNISRATFWQAKKESNSSWIKNTTASSIPQGCFDFKGQFNQWELLSYRPEIGHVAKFKPPKTLLSSFDSPSIGSFGVFYAYKKDLELNYSVAEFITSPLPLPSKSSKSKAPQTKMHINGKLSKYYYNGEEKIVCGNIYDFFYSLMSNNIGAIIDTNKSEHRWLINYVKEQVDISESIIYGNNSEDFNGYFFPTIEIDDNRDNYLSGEFSILVLDTTETAQI